MKNIKFVAVILIMSFIACDKDPVIPTNPNQINFQAPVVGQENYYLSYSGVCGELAPTGDTLIWRIKDLNGSDLELEELYTTGSPSYQPLSFVYPAKWSEKFIDIQPEFRQNSQLFFFYGSDTLRLKQSASLTLVQSNCILWDGETDFVGDHIGTVKMFKVGNLEYPRKKIVSCVPTIVNLDAYLVYDQNNLYSSYTSTEGGWFPQDNPTAFAYALIDIGQ